MFSHSFVCTDTYTQEHSSENQFWNKKLLFQRLKSVFHLSLQCSIFNCYTNRGYSDNAFSFKVRLNLCRMVNLKIISSSVINLINSSFISANKSIYSFICLLDRWFQIRLVISRFLDVHGNLEISDYTSLVPGIHINTLLQAVSYCQ